jgi:hypothetical protein
MSTTVYALLLMALLNGKAPVSQPQETTLAQLPMGSAGKVSLALRMDERLDKPRPESVGLVGEYHNGRFIRVDRGWREDNRLSVGVRREF